MKALFVVFLLQASAALVHAVWVKEMENPGLFQGDIVVDPDERDANGGFSYASMKGGRWPNAEVPYVIDYSLTPEPKAVQAIKDAIADYHKYTCIRWKPRIHEQAYVLFYKGFGCSSPVGHRAGRINSISLDKGCWHKGTTMHEMGHSMGFWHEQSRPDRDHYIKILWENIMEGLKYNFNIEKDVDSLGTPYDLESMMHYGTTAFSRKGRRTIEVLDYNKRLLIGQRRGFSNIDVLQLNLMYKCPVYKGTVPPKVCEDDHKYNCAKYKKRGWCKLVAAETSMYKYCCKTCFGDEVGGAGHHTRPPTKHVKPTKPVEPTKPGSCVDVTDKQTCSYWASLGNCESRERVLREFMKKNCCATCRDHHG